MESENLYFDILSGLEEKNVRYLIVGGYAAILFGANRMTNDMDIIVDLQVDNLKACFDVLKANHFLLFHPYIKENEVTPEKILKWKIEKNMKALRFESKLQPFLMVDIILDLPKDFDLLYENRFQKKAGKSSLTFIGKEDLIEMKSMAGRLRDYQDNFSITGEAIWLEKMKEKYSNDKR